MSDEKKWMGIYTHGKCFAISIAEPCSVVKTGFRVTDNFLQKLGGSTTLAERAMFLSTLIDLKINQYGVPWAIGIYNNREDVIEGELELHTDSKYYCQAAIETCEQWHFRNNRKAQLSIYMIHPTELEKEFVWEPAYDDDCKPDYEDKVSEVIASTFHRFSCQNAHPLWTHPINGLALGCALMAKDKFDDNYC